MLPFSSRYACETWILKANSMNEIEAFEMWSYKEIGVAMYSVSYRRSEKEPEQGFIIRGVRKLVVQAGNKRGIYITI